MCCCVGVQAGCVVLLGPGLVCVGWVENEERGMWEREDRGMNVVVQVEQRGK